jgi:hypothetical protein
VKIKRVLYAASCKSSGRSSAVAGRFVDTGRVLAVTELGLPFSHSVDPWTHLLLRALGAALAMLRPGTCSVGCASIRAEAHSYFAGVDVSPRYLILSLPEWQQICTNNDRIKLMIQDSR